MKATDLMIGSYVSYKGGSHRVIGIKKDDDGDYRAQIDDKYKSWILVSELEPIPITPEILGKNGFSGESYSMGVVGFHTDPIPEVKDGLDGSHSQIPNNHECIYGRKPEERHCEYCSAYCPTGHDFQRTEGLDEAATQAHIRLEESGELSFLNIFKAGAEWDRSQGEVVEGTLGYGPHLQKPIIHLERVPSFYDGHGQEVIVQIRKK